MEYPDKAKIRQSFVNDILGKKIGLTDAHRTILREASKVSWFLEDIRHDPRKEAAQKITAKYTDWRKSYAFMALDNKPMPDKMLADLIIQNCK
jgi:hypothetical protein